MFSPSVSASKCAVEPALLIGMLVVSPMTIDVGAPLHVELGLVGRNPAVLPQLVLLDHFHAAVRGDRDQQVIGHFRALFAAQDLLRAVDLLDVEEGFVLDAQPVEFGRRPLGDVLQTVHATDRVGVMQLHLVGNAALLEVIVQHEGDFQRRHRALVRHADGDHHVAALEFLQPAHHLQRRLLGIEELGIFRQAFHFLGHHARTGGDHQHVVIVGLAALRYDLVVVELERLDRVHMELDALLEQAGLIAIQRVRRAAADGKVEQAGLIQMPVRRRQHGDAGFSRPQFGA